MHIARRSSAFSPLPFRRIDLKINLPRFFRCSTLLPFVLFLTFCTSALEQQNASFTLSPTPTISVEKDLASSINFPVLTPADAAGRATPNQLPFHFDDFDSNNLSLPSPSPSSAPASSDEFVLRYDDIAVQTTSGSLRGTRQISQGRSIVQFLGVPYAQPPVGDLRFMPPQPFVISSPQFQRPIAEALDCSRYKVACPSAFDGSTWFQPLRYAAQTPFFSFQNRDHSTIQPNYDPVQSEDCLHLNIFIPSSSPGRPFSNAPSAPSQPDLLQKRRELLLPVLVILHGGLWHAGSAVWLNAAHLAIKGNFIVATVNYRLGALGFLFNGAELPHDNLGLRDQNLALRWIRENIENFGGDPFRITLSGFEAGATSVAAQIVTPPASDPSSNSPRNFNPNSQLFQRAVLLSGIDYHGQIVHNPREQQQQLPSAADSLLDFAGCRGLDALRCLQRIPVDDVLRWQALMSNRFVLGPVYNSAFLPFGSVIEGMLQRPSVATTVPMIIGFDDVLPLTQSGLLPIGDILIQSGLVQSAEQFRLGLSEQEWRRNILPFLTQLLVGGRPVSPVVEQALSFAYTFNSLGPTSALPPNINPPATLPAPPPPQPPQPPQPFPNVYYDPVSRKIINAPPQASFQFVPPPQQQYQRTAPGDDAGIERDHALANLRLLEKFVSDAAVGVPTHRLIQAILSTTPPPLATTLGSPLTSSAPVFYYYWTYSRQANSGNVDVRRDQQLDRLAFDRAQPPQFDPSQDRSQRIFPFGDDTLFFLFDPEHIQSESDAITAEVWTDALTSFIWSGSPNPLDLTPDEFFPPAETRHQWLPTDGGQPSYLLFANSQNFLEVNKGINIQTFTGIPRDREFAFWGGVVQELYRSPLQTRQFLQPSACCAELQRSREPRTLPGAVVGLGNAAVPFRRHSFTHRLNYFFWSALFVLAVKRAC